MNYRYLFLVVFLSIFISCQQKTLNVLCIGDSITQGKVVGDSITELSYRFWLWEKLDADGYKVNMLGTNSIWFHENRDSLISTPISHFTGHVFDRDHEGYYGIKTGETLLGGFTHDSVLYNSFNERIKKLDKADVAFIHIGSNDTNGDSLQIISYIKQLVEHLYLRNAKTKIVLAKLNTPWVRYINHSIEPLIAELKKEYPKMQLHYADMASDWVNCPEAPKACTLDWAHPNLQGQKNMADKWYKAFKSFDDKTKPVFNGTIKVTQITDSTATATWEAATDNQFLAGYNLYLNGVQINWRYSECGKHEKQCLSLVSETNYTLTNLKKGKNYSLIVKAVDYANNETSLSEVGF